MQGALAKSGPNYTSASRAFVSCSNLSAHPTLSKQGRIGLCCPHNNKKSIGFLIGVRYTSSWSLTSALSLTSDP